MVRIDWTASSRPKNAPGIYYAEVSKAELKNSRKGDQMFQVTLTSADNGDQLCMDWIMLGGDGAGIGIAKLHGLGFKDSDADVDAVDLIGKRCYVKLVERPYKDKDGNDAVSLSVDTKAKPHCGYWPEGQAPEGYVPISSDPSSPF